jgi:Lrp/AsnC family transcriptional regulator, regulator for asnA, asnC and gidA
MPHDLDAVDQQIIRILQQDGRTPNVEIARRIGVSEATVRKRLERLTSEDIIRVTAVPNADKVGFSTVTFLTFDVELSQVDRIAERLGRLPEVRSIYYTTGESDLVVEAWFSSGNSLLLFLTHHIASIPGIKRTATSHVLRTIKDGSAWALPSACPPRVLVVDDDPDFVEIVRLTLTAEGFEVASASHGEEALALMRVSKPDVVILDIMMHGILDGLGTAKQMHTDGDLRSVPILMVSSITNSSFASLLPKDATLPAANFLVKPIEASLLVAETRRLLRSR